MSKPTRGSLSSLSDRLAPKALLPSASQPIRAQEEEAHTLPSASAPEPSTPAGMQPQADARDFKTMMCRVNRAGWAEMSRLSIDLGRNLEDMLIEAANDFLTKNGRPPVVEKRSPAKK